MTPANRSRSAAVALLLVGCRPAPPPPPVAPAHAIAAKVCGERQSWAGELRPDGCVVRTSHFQREPGPDGGCEDARATSGHERLACEEERSFEGAGWRCRCEGGPHAVELLRRDPTVSDGGWYPVARIAPNPTP